MTRFKGFYERINSINVQFLSTQKFDYEFTPFEDEEIQLDSNFISHLFKILTEYKSVTVK